MYMFYVFAILFLIIGLVLKNIKNKRNINISNYDIKNNPMTETEKKFISYLKPTTDKYNLIILPQVQLQSIFKVKNDIASFNKIKSKSVDFAIVDNNYNYKLFIELDDYTHQRKNRIQRDMFVNNLFSTYNLKLIRIKVKNDYLNDIEEIINEVVN